MQAILTKYLPATATRPARIKARCEAGAVIVAYDYDNEQTEHVRAAETLCTKLSQNGKYDSWLLPRVCGQLSDGNYVHVFVTKN